MPIDVTPPGRESQVEKLKTLPGVENPYAVAWASYNHDAGPGEEFDAAPCGACLRDAVPAIDGALVPHLWDDGSGDDGGMCRGSGTVAQRRDIIKHRGGSWVLLSKKTGKVLGKHGTKGEAEAQERAVQASKHSDGATRRVRRFDVFDATSLNKPEKLANGWLRVSGQIARCGIQEYYDAAGKVRRELREPEEVFAPRSRASFALVPLTNTHPTTLLDSMTARSHQVGSISEPQQNGEWLVADMLVTDAGAVMAIESGRVELSGGYEAEIDETPGVHPVYGPYDCRQKNITGNHLALVDEARAGADARLRLDGSDAAMLRSTRSDTQRSTERMMPPTIVIAGRKIEVTDANASEIQKLVTEQKERLDTAQRIALKWIMRLDDPGDGDGDDDDDDEEMDADVDCPQCGGSGKLNKAGEKDAMVGCDMCDGKGQIKASSLGEFGGEIEDDDGADNYDDDAKKDVDELEAEQETEKEAGKAHKDWKERRARKRKDARKAANKRRADAAKRFVAAVNARVDHAARSRATLENEARKVLGADAELAKMDSAGIKRAVVEKAFPQFKCDGKSADVIDDRFAQAVEQGGSAEPVVSHVDQAHAALRTPRIPMPAAGPPTAPSRARVDAARAEREKRMSTIPFDRNKAVEATQAKK